ncbi:MAG TPA: hypothetical protein VHS78_00590 [Candidatus Elarobacter sp.]|jgi:hypothetical protein|nr:hypothetical protein [Candidatus Elarobacter sp.]
MRPDLIGKTVVQIYDPYQHGGGVVPPSASLYEIVIVEADYTGVRLRGSMRYMYELDENRRVQQDFMDLERLEPGDRLDRYLPGGTAWFGEPDFVYFQGPERRKWNREHATPTGS